MTDDRVQHRCSECSRAVAVAENGELIRGCGHVDAPVVGAMAAVMKGAGGLKVG